MARQSMQKQNVKSRKQSGKCWLGLMFFFICRYKPVDHKQIVLPLREAFEDLFSQTYSRKQNLTFLGHVQTCFRGKRWQDLLRLMEHVCKSALANELKKKPNGTELKNRIKKTLMLESLMSSCVSVAASLKKQWEAMASKLSQTQQQMRTCETTMVFAFVEVNLHTYTLVLL